MSDAQNDLPESKLPKPLVPADADLRGFLFMPLYRARFLGSLFHAHATDAEWRAGLTLYLRSWDQLPAGTLPPQDVALCRLAELGRDLRAWEKVKTRALHGWHLCSDNRLHHPVVAEYVNKAWAKRRTSQANGKLGAQSRWSEDENEFDEPIENKRSTDSKRHSVAIAQPKPGYGNRDGDGERERERERERK